MNDRDIAKHIGDLIEREHELERAGEPDPEQLRAIEVELDQCWDLLRQRRARRSAGQDPDNADTRPPGVVEDYLQ